MLTELAASLTDEDEMMKKDCFEVEVVKVTRSSLTLLSYTLQTTSCSYIMLQ